MEFDKILLGKHKYNDLRNLAYSLIDWIHDIGSVKNVLDKSKITYYIVTFYNSLIFLILRLLWEMQ